MSKPRPLSGFPEFLPAERVVEAEVVATLARTFELHGFSGIETRSVEPLDQLLRKGDTSKEVYVLRRLQDADAGSDSGVGLHFDLTVPFARYVLEHAGKLEFPFRRYQIQKAWRGERPQEGRFREFTQADIDIVGRDELPFHHDIEVARVMLDALGRLATFLPGLRLQVNNRKLIQGFYAGIGADDIDEVMRLVDKLDKLEPAQVRTLLVDEAGLTGEQADQCLALAGIRASDDSFVERVRALGVEHDLLDRGPRRAGRAGPWLRAAGDRPGPHRGRPVHRPRPGLLHRHRLRDPPRRLRVARVDLLRRPLRRARQRRPDDVPRRGHLPRASAGCWCRWSSAAWSAAAGRCPAPSSSPSSTRSRAATATPSPPRCAPAGSPARSPPPPRSSASRSGTPSGGASRSSGSPRPTGGHEVKDIRTGEQVSADPAAWTPPTEDLRPQVVTKEQ